MVDSTDRGRMAIARSELASLLAHEHLGAAPVLVLANKQDLPDAMAVPELTEALGLRSIAADWHVQVSLWCCCNTGNAGRSGALVDVHDPAVAMLAKLITISQRHASRYSLVKLGVFAA